MRLWPSKELVRGHPQIEIRSTFDRGKTGQVLAMVRCLSNEPRATYTSAAVDLDVPTTSELHRFIRQALHEIKTLPCPTCGRVLGSSTLRS